MLLFRRSLKYGRAIAKSIENHPTITNWVTVSVLMLGGYTILHREGSKRTNQGIAKRLKAGSNPKESHRSLEYSVNRSDVVKSIQKLLFESDPDNGRIGVILGPTGSGKTRAVIEACSVTPGPIYILYQEIYQTSKTVGKQLAHAANIPLSRNTFDYIYRFLGFDSLFYFPSDPVEAMTYVLNKVAKRSMEAFEKEDLKRLPCIVIDASELLVDEPAIFNTLLRLAQYYVRTKQLRIVLVDSDGITLSKINESLKHPIVDIVEVEDLKDHDAEQYLIERTKMSSDLAKCLVGLIGGRLLYLSCAVDIFEAGFSEEILYDRIKEHLSIKVVAPIENIITNTTPISKRIVECFCENSKPLFPSELKKHIPRYDPVEIQKVIDVLLYGNLLRYNADGKLMWHSRLVETEMKAQYSNRNK